MKFVFATFLVVSLVLISSFLQTTTALAGPSYPCKFKCKVRCSKAGEYKRCMKYCGICCQKCKCVPKGTYGNKSECPCYQNMLNSKGKSKCP